MTGPRLLVADDDEAERRALTWLLRERGFAVTAVNGSEHVLPALSAEPADAVVLDARHPGTAACAVVEQMRADARFQGIPVVLVSALPTDDLVTRTLALGASDVLRKPIRAAELVARLDGQLRARRALADARGQPEREEPAPAAGPALPAALAEAQEALTAARAENRRLEQLAQVDPLTELLNRRALAERLSTEMERVRRYDTTLSLLLIDLDHFKQVNDTHGHLVGDDVLMETAAVLQRAVRSVDLVARYGGEEFVIVLPETATDGALRFAERVRELVEAQPFRADGRELRLTASVGVAAFPSRGVESVDDLLAAADAALYRAKAAGRNRVEVQGAGNPTWALESGA